MMMNRRQQTSML